MSPVAALLLTGGASSRMGVDKATLVVDGEMCALRIARLLRAHASIVLEVGPGHTGLACVEETHPGEGPLTAIAAGAAGLRSAGHNGPALVFACDLPLVTSAVVAHLAGHPGGASVLPVVNGRPQPLCARWSAADLDAADALVATGERSLRLLPDRARAVLIDESGWSSWARPDELADADTPAALDALLVSWRPLDAERSRPMRVPKGEEPRRGASDEGRPGGLRGTGGPVSGT